jgi:hypothetical protein
MLEAEGKPQFDLISLKDALHDGFMGNYCEQHPAADYKDGALELMNSLPRIP